VFDEREIIVIGFLEVKPGQDPMKILQIDVKERLDNPLKRALVDFQTASLREA